MSVDLHIHTIASDGLDTPQEVVAKAASKGLRAIAITDHDTVAGIPEGIVAGLKYGIEIIPGIEINTSHCGKEVHVLGYFIDYKSDLLSEQLACIIKKRRDRIVKIVSKLNLLGIEIEAKEVFSYTGDSVPGRPHIARTLVQKKILSSGDEAFDKYLGEQAPAYVPRKGFSPMEAIELITRVGGVPVLAHPGISKCDKIIDELVTAGLQGIEVYHSEHTDEQATHYHHIAKKYGLVVTGGSDYHGAELKHRRIGSAVTDYLAVKRLKELSSNNKKS